MLMLSPQHRNLCVVSDFILLRENAVIGAETECGCSCRPSAVLAVTGSPVFGKCEAIVPSPRPACWKEIVSVGLEAEPACGELNRRLRRRVRALRGQCPGEEGVSGKRECHESPSSPLVRELPGIRCE